MSDIILRPHHALCIRFFVGHGYSDEFTENMSGVIDLLNRTDPEITLTLQSDIICAHCPRHVDGVCGDKAGRYDDAVLKICGLRSDERVRWSELYEKTDREIVRSGLLCSVCGDCQWQYLCSIH